MKKRNYQKAHKSLWIKSVRTIAKEIYLWERYFQRLAKRKQKKQVELDKCAFDPEHMAEEAHHGNGGSFPMVTTTTDMF